MFEIKEISQDEIELIINMPNGFSASELIEICSEALEKLDKKMFYGKRLKLNGRMTVFISAMIVAYFKNIVANIAFYIPRENNYIYIFF